MGSTRVLLGLVILSIFAMPFWQALGAEAAVRAAFSPYCHQRFDRSLVVAGAVLPVCARCTGLWAGAWLAALILPAVRSVRRIPRLVWLGWAAVPMVIDLALEHLAGLGPHGLSRMLTGLCFGAAVASFVIPALVRAGEEIRERCETRSSTSQV